MSEMLNAMSIEQIIDLVMEKHNLSLTGLAEKLGYKSKTSLNRIINGMVKEVIVFNQM